MSSRKIVCAVSGKAYTFAKDYFDKKVSEYGDEDSLKKYFITRKVKGYLNKGYSVHGKDGTTDPPAVNSGSLTLDFLSGDPAQNIFAFFPFYVAAGVGIIVAVLFVTKKRT